ncbi:MAG TPA: TIGR03435 family protein [Bryobacteraceae bacterium]|nr:TIGR03435 family protein [Bryobacteraceae bacterium]
MAVSKIASVAQIAVTGVILSAALSAQAVAQDQPDRKPVFDVASVKLTDPGPQSASLRNGRIRFSRFSLMQLLDTAYQLKPYQIIGPSWLKSNYYDILATAPPDTTPDEARVMLQNLLIDRFQMKLHWEDRDLPVYELTVNQGGPKLKPSQISSDSPEAQQARFRFGPGYGSLQVKTLGHLASGLSGYMDRPVLDKTGIQGVFDLNLEFSTDGLPGALARAPIATPQNSPAEGASAELTAPKPSLFAALKDLGLKLETGKLPTKCLIIDQVEKTPTEN